MFLVFIMKWAIALTLLYSLYGLFLSRETFYTVNRCVLLSIIVISAVLPFVHITTEHHSVVNSAVETMSQQLVLRPEEAKAVDSNVSSAALVVLIVYMCGLVVMTGRYVISLVSVLNILRGSKREEDYYINDKVDSPFSWFNFIVISRADIERNGKALLAHERVHAHRGHSYDLLFCDICCLLQWFNPFAWMLKEDLCAVHEYEADYGVTHCEGVDYHDYQLLLIDKATEKQLPGIVNSINRSSLKHRLKQMYRKPSSRSALLKVIYVLPLSMFVMYAFASPHVTQELKTFAAKAKDGLTKAERKILMPIIEEGNEKEDEGNAEVIAHAENETTEHTTSDEVIINPDTPPQFENGMKDFAEYFYTYSHMPRIASDNKVKGLVVVYFVVEKDGSVSGVEIESSDATSEEADVSPEILDECKEAFEEETKRMIYSMHEWRPGTHNGAVARCAFSTVIRF